MCACAVQNIQRNSGVVSTKNQVLEKYIARKTKIGDMLTCQVWIIFLVQQKNYYPLSIWRNVKSRLYVRSNQTFKIGSPTSFIDKMLWVTKTYNFAKISFCNQKSSDMTFLLKYRIVNLKVLSFIKVIKLRHHNFYQSKFIKSSKWHLCIS